MTFDAKAIRRIAALEGSGYTPIIRELARSHAAPLYWFRPDGAVGERIARNGTGCFVDTGARTILITCDHVYSQWLTDVERDRKLICQIGGATFDPEEVLIDRDAALDLATFDMSPIVANLAGANFHAPRSWPPPPLEETDVVLIGGYPGVGRSEGDDRTHFLFPSFIKRVTSVAPDRVSLQLEMDEAHSPQSLIPPHQPDLGGASGGPVFRIREQPLVGLELVGIVYEYQQSFELVFARPTTFVGADGTLGSAL